MRRTYRLDPSKPAGERMVDVTDKKAALEELRAARWGCEQARQWHKFKQEALAEAKEEAWQAAKELERAANRLDMAMAAIEGSEDAA